MLQRVIFGTDQEIFGIFTYESGNIKDFLYHLRQEKDMMQVIESNDDLFFLFTDSCVDNVQAELQKIRFTKNNMTIRRKIMTESFDELQPGTWHRPDEHKLWLKYRKKFSEIEECL